MGKEDKSKVASLPVTKEEAGQDEQTDNDDQLKDGEFILTNGDIDALLNSFDEDVSPLVNFYNLRTVPIEKSFKLEQLASDLRPIFRIITSKKMILVEKYGARDKKGNLIQNAPGVYKIANQARLNREFNTLMAIENKINWTKITLDRKKDLPEKGISGRDIAIMRKVIDFVEEKDGKEEMV